MLSKIAVFSVGSTAKKIGFAALLAALSYTHWAAMDYGRSKERAHNNDVKLAQIAYYQQTRDEALEIAKVAAKKAETVKIKTKVVFKHINHEVIRYVETIPDIDIYDAIELQLIRNIVDATKRLSNPRKPVSADRVATRLPNKWVEKRSVKNVGAMGRKIQRMSRLEKLSGGCCEKITKIIQDLT